MLKKDEKISGSLDSGKCRKDSICSFIETTPSFFSDSLLAHFSKRLGDGKAMTCSY